MIIGVIPARFASTRLPGKLLADLGGQSVLERTWRKAKEAVTLDRIIIAAGDERISESAREFGGEVVEVFDDLQSGSDRIFRAVENLEKSSIGTVDDDSVEFNIIVNIQGDEPFLDPTTIDRTVERLQLDSKAQVATPAAPISTPEDFANPAVVKVVMDATEYAMYFSRSPIPYGWNSLYNSVHTEITAYHHIGLYAYRRSALR
ncbi:MAG: manno-octulosonate cytidylyltransferase, partial [Candidatus Electryoneaceae bacterium]|nr:manno-octulosonate cytidylyltransferase [Candidatus Electryoneaceae bacterium]